MKNQFRNILLVFFICFPFCGKALINLDSLQKEINKATPDSATISQYLIQFAFLPEEDNQAKMMIIKWAIFHAENQKLYTVHIKAYLYLGEHFRLLQKYSEATECYNKAIKIAEEHNDASFQARAYNLLGVMSYEFDQLDQAIDYYKKAIDLGTKADDQKRLSTYYYNLSGMYFEKHDQSRDTGLMAIELAKYAAQLQVKFNDFAPLSVTFNGLAHMFIEMGQTDSALSYLKIADTLLPIVKDETKYITHYFRYASAYAKLNDYKQVLKYLDKGMPIVLKYNASRNEYLYYRLYAIAYSKLNNLPLANSYNEKYISLHDSLISIDNYQKSQQIYARYEVERKQNEINKLSKENQIKQLLIEKEEKEKENLRLIIITSVILLVTLTIFSLILFRVNKLRKKINLDLQQKNEEIKEQSNILNTQSKLISRYQSQMNPHFVFNALNSIQGKILSANTKESISQVALLAKLMRTTLENSEKENIAISEELEYLKLYIQFEEIKLGKKVIFHFDSPKDSVLIPPMMIQPLVENVFKHGKFQADQIPEIRVSFAVSEYTLFITVCDNGAGTASTVEEIIQTSHALSILVKRLSLLWQDSEMPSPTNTLEIQTSPKKGFTIKFSIPLIFEY